MNLNYFKQFSFDTCVTAFLYVFLIQHNVTKIIKSVTPKHEYVLEVVKSIFGEQISAWCVRGTIARFKNNNGLNGWKKWNRGAEKPTSKVWSRAVRWVGRGETRGWDRYWRGCHCWTMNNREDYTNTADLKGFIVDIWFIVVLLIYEENFDRLIIMHSTKKNINVFPIYLGIVI